MQYLGDFPEDATVYIPFNTFTSDDPQASATITNLVAGDIKVHKDGSATQIVTDGATVAIDFDSITGNHLITIDTSAHADYSVGSDYMVRIEGTTVDAGTINAWVGSFSIENRWNEVDVVSLAGVVQSLTDLKDFADAGYDPATNKVQGVVLTDTATTLTNKTGFSLAATGLDAIAQSATGVIEIAKAIWDRVLSGGTHNIANSAGRRLRQLQESGAAYGGHIWIDTVNGTAGTTSYENGTSDNPVDTIADANTLAAALGISRFQVAPGSTITFAASQQNQAFYGTEWTLALGGQDIAGTYIEGASVTGICTGASHHLVRCSIGNMSSADGKYGWCGFSGTFTMTAAADYKFHHCFSAIAGSGSPVWEFGAAVGNSNLSMRDHSGGVQIDNKNATGTDLMSLEGNGQLIVSASSGGAISLRGNFSVTNTGGATITYDDNTQNGIDTLADTNELQGDWADGGRLDTILDELTTQGDTNEAAIGALNDLSAANVLTQVNAALDTAIAELGVAAPTATPTIRTGLMLMYMMARNKVDVDTTGTDAMKVYNDAGTQITSKAITDDGTDYSEAKMS